MQYLPPREALLWVVFTLTAACSSHGQPIQRGAATRHSTRPSMSTAGGTESVVTDPATALDARLALCIHRVAHGLPPELSATLADLDDDTLLSDACRMDVALNAGVVSLCAGVSLGGLRQTCFSRVAMALGQPALCPLAIGLMGHDPTCVAIASRHPRLCVSANITERGRCIALARRDRYVCDTLDPLLRPSCRRDVIALANILPAMPDEAPREGTAGAVVSIGTSPTPVEYTLESFARGVLLGDDGALWLMDSTRPWPVVSAMAMDLPVPAVRVPMRNARVGVDLPAEARVLLPGGRVLDTGTQSARAVVHFETLPHEIGSRVRGTVTVDGVSAGELVRFILDVDTFVRDVVSAAALR